VDGAAERRKPDGTLTREHTADGPAERRERDGTDDAGHLGRSTACTVKGVSLRDSQTKRQGQQVNRRPDDPARGRVRPPCRQPQGVNYPLKWRRLVSSPSAAATPSKALSRIPRFLSQAGTWWSAPSLITRQHRRILFSHARRLPVYICYCSRAKRVSLGMRALVPLPS
jgi:hypothetical protein